MSFQKSHLSNNSYISLNNFQKISISNSTKKPIVLIICDEYNSPTGLFRVKNDSTFFDFSTHLKKKGWVVRDSIYSYETSTIYSISSIFNFNLSKNNSLSRIDSYSIGHEKLINSRFFDSLSSKDIKFLNFGIFNIGDTEALTNLYNFPENFTEQILFNTIYYHLINNTAGVKLSGIKQDYIPMENHNKFIFNSFPDSINSFNTNKIFAYVHLYMPHAPFFYREEFETPLNSDLNGYIKFWYFTNSKLNSLLDQLMVNNNYRIVLIGDHGYRGDSRINPNETFMATYGFLEQDLETIKSVQDLGNLINACY